MSCGDTPVADDKAGLAQYANYFRIGFNAAEFVLDFCQAYQDGDEPTLVYRVVITPAGAEELHALIEGSLAEFRAGLGGTSATGH